MLLTFGILALFVGGALLSLAIPRLLVARGSSPEAKPYALKLLIISIVVLCAAIFMVHQGQETAESGVNIGILLFFVGLIVILLGTWMGFWGPISSRNAVRGLQMILIGLFIMVIGILALSDVGFPSLSTSSSLGEDGSTIDWGEILTHKMGPIPFGLFALAILIGANGMTLQSGPRFRDILGTNLVVLASLILAYAMGPTLFSNW